MAHPGSPTRGAIALAVALAAVPAAAAGSPLAGPADAPSAGAPLVTFTRSDAAFGLAAAVAVGAAAFADHELRGRALATDGVHARRLSRLGEHLGSPEVVAPAIALAWLAGRALDRPALAAASLRVGVPVALTGVATLALKLAVGRVRPEDSAAEPDTYRPFSGHGSFPSGHASVAFAAATALDRETGSRWVPWVVYPLAGLVAWSRVRDDRHWTSDVVAGAALGAWTAAKTHEALRARAGRGGWLGLRVEPAAGGLRAAWRREL
jgi:membrane-associated phospholipid phosphatase